MQVWIHALSCCSKTPLERLIRRFHGWQFSAGLASLQSTLQLLYFLGKRSNIITSFASQNTVAIGWGGWGPNGLLTCASLDDHIRLLKRYHVKCLMPVLFFPPEFANQSIPDSEHSYTCLRRGHQVASRPCFIFQRPS